MAVRGEAEDDLVERHARRVPRRDATDRAALLVRGRGAGVVERRVGADGGAPGAPDVVVHDRDPVEGLGEAGDVRESAAIRTHPREDRCRCGQDEVLANGICPKLLEEREEVGCVIRVDGVATDTLSTGVLPARKHKNEVTTGGDEKKTDDTYSKSMPSKLY